jgi:DNA-binding NarL/FixJ family response regulator
MDAAVLSPRQQQVLAMVVSGATNRDISLRLAYSVSTVKSDAATILRTFGLDNRTQLSAYVARNPYLIDPGARTVD